MAMPYMKDNLNAFKLCSPTSALENKQMLGHLGEELEESILMDSNTCSYSREGSIRKHLGSLTSLSDLANIAKVAKSTKSGN
jgi:hypothetical protein